MGKRESLGNSILAEKKRGNCQKKPGNGKKKKLGQFPSKESGKCEKKEDKNRLMGKRNREMGERKTSANSIRKKLGNDKQMLSWFYSKFDSTETGREKKMFSQFGSI